MLGMGLLMVLLVIGIPVLLVFAFLGGAAGFLPKQNHSADSVPQPTGAATNPVVQSGQTVVTPVRFCTHCGAGLQSDWTHCPQCGAPIG